MVTITISEDKFNKVLTGVGNLIDDVVDLFDQDDIVKKRLAQIKKNPSIAKTENDLDRYLKKRGVKSG